MEIEISGKIYKKTDRHAAEVSKQTGFPSAATHYTEQSIDLHEKLTINKNATFYIRIGSDTWKSFGIRNKDVLIVDRSTCATFDNLALVVKNGEFLILRIPFDRAQESFTIWGVITYIIHKAR